MRLKEDIRPATYLKTKAPELLKQVKESRRPVVITQAGEATAVVLDIASYEALRDATLLLKLASQAENDLQAGRFLPQAQALARVRKRLPSR